MAAVLKQSNNTALVNYTLALADDALILGHRLSEWCSRGPTLEEDIALSNIALDHLGRARLYYQYAASLCDGKSEDDFAYLRNARGFRNYLILELPRGDFAFTIARQLLIDVYQKLFLERLMASSDTTLAAIAEKAIKENSYHLRHSGGWLLKLGDGTDESHQRMQRALNELWGYTHEMFEADASAHALIENRTAVDPAEIQTEWLDEASSLINDSTLSVPAESWAVRGGRDGYHTEHLGLLLAEMQSVHRAHPGCQW